MDNKRDSSNALIRPPIAWALAFVAGLGLDWLQPMPFVPAFIPAAWLGGAMFSLGFALAIWAVVTIRKAGSRVEINMPTTTIVTTGPYRLTRNPIYVAMFLGQVGLAVGFNSLWLLATLVLFYFVIRYGVSLARRPIWSASSPTPIWTTNLAFAAGCERANRSFHRSCRLS